MYRCLWVKIGHDQDSHAPPGRNFFPSISISQFIRSWLVPIQESKVLEKMRLNLTLLSETPVLHQTSMLRRVVDDREKCDCNVEHLQLRFATYIVHACSCWDVFIAAKSVGYFGDTWISRVQRRNLTDVILGGVRFICCSPVAVWCKSSFVGKIIKLKQGSNTQPKATQANCKNGSYPMENWSTWVCLFWLLIIILQNGHKMGEWTSHIFILEPKYLVGYISHIPNDILWESNIAIENSPFVDYSSVVIDSYVRLPESKPGNDDQSKLYNTCVVLTISKEHPIKWAVRWAPLPAAPWYTVCFFFKYVFMAMGFIHQPS